MSSDTAEPPREATDDSVYPTAQMWQPDSDEDNRLGFTVMAVCAGMAAIVLLTLVALG